MAKNATPLHVYSVLQALAEEFLVDVPATFDGVGTYQIEYTKLVNYLLNSPDEVYENIATYVNERENDASI